MRRTMLALVSGLAVSCAGVNATQAEEVNARLARIEARLDDLAARMPGAYWAPTRSDAADTWRALERAEVVTRIDELKARGFTDNYLPLRQLRQEYERLNDDGR